MFMGKIRLSPFIKNKNYQPRIMIEETFKLDLNRLHKCSLLFACSITFTGHSFHLQDLFIYDPCYHMLVTQKTRGKLQNGKREKIYLLLGRSVFKKANYMAAYAYVTDHFRIPTFCKSAVKEGSGLHKICGRIFVVHPHMRKNI